VGPALILLDKLLDVVERAGAGQQIIESLVLQALALQHRGHKEQAQAVLSRALNLAEPEGFVRTFLDEGPSIGELLREAARRGTAGEYAARLLTALEEAMQQRGIGTRDPTPVPRACGEPLPAPLFEPLSDREQEVLRLLDTHLSTPEIAQELVISWHTVRTHIKHIYGKLGAHSRADAVQRARQLGLI